MTTITEISADVYRISLLAPEMQLQFNHFLIKDEEPLLYHTGLNATFPVLQEAVAKILGSTPLRWIGFSHFESDECGSLNKWLDAYPASQPVSTFLGATLNLHDFAQRPVRVLGDDETLATGAQRFRFRSTAHLPHGWDGSVLFEETSRMLLCSDLLFHFGDVEPLTESDIVGRAREALLSLESTPYAYSVPYTPQTDRILAGLAALEPRLLATMHGSSFAGDGAGALRDFGIVLKEISERASEPAPAAANS